SPSSPSHSPSPTSRRSRVPPETSVCGAPPPWRWSSPASWSPSAASSPSSSNRPSDGPPNSVAAAATAARNPQALLDGHYKLEVSEGFGPAPSPGQRV